MGELGAVILAAGLSSRMRDFKPMLELGGRTIISRVAELLRNAGAEPIVVVTGHRASEIECHLKNVRFIKNENFASTHMLDSLLIGLSQIPPDCRRVFIMPADIPLVQPETFERLLCADGQFVRPTYRGENGHPALISADLIPALRSYEGSEGLRGAVEEAGIVITNIETDDRGILLDADTPEDYTELRRYYYERLQG